MENIKQKAIRSGLARICGQAINFLVTVANVTVMARLLDPNDYGLVAMATSITGIYAIFASAGLSLVTIQRVTITEDEISTLFWMNMLTGVLFALLCLASAPILAKFFREPRLFWVTVVLAGGFIVSALGVQHSALLQRHLRYIALTIIETASGAMSVAIGIIMALAGFGYWSLVATNIAVPTIIAILVWITTGWVPGAPNLNVGIRSMLRYGGTMTLNSLVSYLTFKVDKILLGRFWGADVLGLYTRAYTLMSTPTETLNAAVGTVIFSALSRVQQDPNRLKNYFLKGYSLVNSLTLPTTVFCALFSHDIILVVLGPKWLDTEPIFRLLTPTILSFGITGPFIALLPAIGLQERSLKIALVMAPLLISAYLIGLPYGAKGVAFCYSAAMVLWLIPHILWSIRGTIFSFSDILLAMGRPLISAIAAALGAFVIQYYVEPHSPFFRLGLVSVSMFALYYFILLFVMGQNALYLDLLRSLRASSESSF
jgi:O-antigen/teichoic acid export membrane protein